MAIVTPEQLHRLHRLVESLVDLHILEDDQATAQREAEAARTRSRQERADVVVQLHEVLAELIAREVAS